VTPQSDLIFIIRNSDSDSVFNSAHFDDDSNVYLNCQGCLLNGVVREKNF